MQEWFKPGIAIKRWVVIIGLGILSFAVSIALAFHGWLSTMLLLPKNETAALIFVIGIALTSFGSYRLYKRFELLIFPENFGRLEQSLKKLQLSQGPKIVCIGGGTGTYTALLGLKHYTHNLTAIVSMADSGGSTGKLRDEFGILPPGDVRRCLIALSKEPPLVKRLFQYRFAEKSSLHGHSFGNLFLTVLQNMTGDDAKAIEEEGNILRISGAVLPVTLGKTNLHAKLENGKIIKGETNIDIPKHNAQLKITKIFLQSLVTAYSKAVLAIKEADLIVIGPGDLYTSVLPNLLVGGIPEAIRKSKAKKIYVCNLMTKLGETSGFTAAEFVREVISYLKGKPDAVLVNNALPDPKQLAPYKKEWSELVECNPDVIAELKVEPIFADLLLKESLVRHDPDKLAKAVMEYLTR